MSIKYLACVLLLGIFVCARETALTVVTAVSQPPASQTIMTSDAGQPAQASSETPVNAAEQPPIKLIGEFSNFKGDGEHCYGERVELWQQGENIHGIISAQDFSLCGDTPVGILENVRFSPETKKISFRAKLSLGLSSDEDNKWVPSRDVFEFDGLLANEKLTGAFNITNEICPDKCRETKKVTLRRLKKDTFLIESEYPNYAEWEARVNAILKRRGPRW